MATPIEGVSKIKFAAPDMRDGVQGSYSTKNGTYFNIRVELEDGTKGQASQSEAGCRWQVGTEVKYTYTPNENPKYSGRLKLEKVNSKNGYGGGGGFKQDNAGIEVGHSITCAVHNLGVGASIDAIRAKALEFLAMSDQLKAERKASQPQDQQQPQQVSTPQNKPLFNEQHPAWAKLVERINSGDKTVDLAKLRDSFTVSGDDMAKLERMQYQRALPADADDLPF